MDLSAEELRVLCVLVEKSFTTPEQYPLTTNALMNGCNQRTSRDPVVAYSTGDVDNAMQSLRSSGWARTVRMTGSRTNKHKHVVVECLPINDKQLALLGVLGLRGPQSPGELKTRTERYVVFDSFDEVVEELEVMAAMDSPLVRNVGTSPGQSQDRWLQLVGGHQDLPEQASTVDRASSTSASTVDGGADPVRPIRHGEAGGTVEQSEPASPARTDQPVQSTVELLSKSVDRLERRVSELEELVRTLSSRL